MSDKQLAIEARDEGLKDGVQKKVEILLQGWTVANTPAEKQQAVQRFQNGLEIYKDAYQGVQQAMNAVFP
jgi:hypothetical protein